MKPLSLEKFIKSYKLYINKQIIHTINICRESDQILKNPYNHPFRKHFNSAQLKNRKIFKYKWNTKRDYDLLSVIYSIYIDKTLT